MHELWGLKIQNFFVVSNYNDGKNFVNIPLFFTSVYITSSNIVGVSLYLQFDTVRYTFN